MGRIGDGVGAQKLADEIEQQNPLNTKINMYWLPTARAAIEMSRNKPAKAIEILKVSSSYELGMPGPQPELGGTLYPVYLQGLAYLELRQGNAAAAEFQKFLDHRGVAINNPLGALARLGLARAHGLQGESTKAKAAYREFLTLWKDADADIPVYQQAKAEYEKLK